MSKSPIKRREQERAKAAADLRAAATRLDRFALEIPEEQRETFSQTVLAAIDAAMMCGRMTRGRSQPISQGAEG